MGVLDTERTAKAKDLVLTADLFAVFITFTTRQKWDRREKMTDFKPINTQEEFDERLKDRLARAESKVRDEYKGWLSPDEVKKLKDSHAEDLKKYEGYDEKFTAQQTRIHELEVGALKTKIALGKNLPMDAIEFLQGDDEKSINESADKLSKLSTPKVTGFTKSTEAPVGDPLEAVYRELAARFTSN